MTPRLEKAIEFMKAAHRSIDQKRRDGVRLYEVHPLDVMDRVSKVTEDEDTLIASVQHDILEDVPSDIAIPESLRLSLKLPDEHVWYFDSDTIHAVWGRKVVTLVVELTDEYTKEAWPDLNRKKRKQLERERYAAMSPEAKLIKLADIASNLADDDGTDAGFMGMFVREKSLCLPYLAMKYAERGDKYYLENDILFREAAAILEKKRFAIR